MNISPVPNQDYKIITKYQHDRITIKIIPGDICLLPYAWEAEIMSLTSCA